MDILDLGVQGSQHREKLEEVKRQVGVTHNHFDGWIFNFLENKKFDVAETVSKLQRRADMERDDLAKYELTDSMLSDMRTGVIQLIGEDKEGRVSFYITTKRDFPKSSQREVRKRTFDIWLSYGTRLRRDNKRCRIAMLINQEDASMWSNTDMGFQSNIALRISKFYPGVVDKMYVCKMGKALAAMAKPIFSALPQVVSEHIFILTDADIKAGRLLQHYDPEILPIPLGGRNDCDTKENWENFARIISEYWGRLSLGLQAGKSVKDWELEQIMAEEAAEKRKLNATAAGEVPLALTEGPGGSTPSEASPNLLATSSVFGRSKSHMTNLSHDADTDDMNTCFSDDDELAEMEDVIVNFSPSVAGGAHPVIIDPFARLDYFMGRARYDIEKEEDIYRVALLMLCGSEGKAIAERGDYDLDEAHTHAALLHIPPNFRAVTKGVLWVFCICLSVYFFAATLFLTIVGSGMITQLFYAAFVDWWNVWPVGVTAMLLAYHLSLLLSRGFGLVITSFRGHIVHPLGQFGSAGFVVQMTCFIMVVVAQFIVFVYYASTIDPVSGARISFSTGWMTCTIIICLFHLFFPLGVRERAVMRDDSGSLSLYLFYDITEQDNPPRSRRSAIVVSLIFVALSLLFGIGFMASTLFFFIVATPIAAAVTAVCINFFTKQREKDPAAPIIRTNAWMLAFMWVWVSIIAGTMDIEGGWVASIAVTCSVVGVLALICILTTSMRSKVKYMYLVKFSYVVMLLLFVACVVISYWVHWGFIIIMLALGLHLLLCTTQYQVTNLAGDAAGVIGPLVIFGCIILLAHGGVQDQYTVPRSEGSVIVQEAVVNRNHRYPVCLSRFAANTTVADLALFSEIVQADTNTTFAVDYDAWFEGQFKDNGIIIDEPAYASIREFEGVDGDLVLAFRSPTDTMLALLCLNFWTEAIAVYPIAWSIPDNWIPGMIDFFGYVDKLVAFPHKAALDRLNAVVADRVASGKTVILTGHGLGGAAASIIGVRNKVSAVAFSTPSLLYVQDKLDLGDDMKDYLTEIRTSNDALGGITPGDDLVQLFNCDEGIMKCSNIRFLAVELMRVCGNPYGRTHVGN